MNAKRMTTLMLVGAFCMRVGNAAAEDGEHDPDAVRFSTLWYLSSVYGSRTGSEYSLFRVGRGYLTAKLRPEDDFGVRVTLDAYQDDGGNLAARFKYLYGQFFFGDLGEVVTSTNLEVGVVHTPWLDFEEHVNLYRMQGSMFMERSGLFNSADFGLTLGGLLGPHLDEEEMQDVGRHYAGRFGSFSVGVYNGGGYHAQEVNENKAIEGRLTVRPLGPLLPNLQLSYLGVVGEGNTPSAPDWSTHAGMVSFQHRYFVLTGTVTTGKGNQKGDAVDAHGDALDQHGVSSFGAIELPWIDTSLIGRVDHFDWDGEGAPHPSRRFIWGAAYHFFGRNAVLVDWDWTYDEDRDRFEEKIVKATLRVDLHS